MKLTFHNWPWRCNAPNYTLCLWKKYQNTKKTYLWHINPLVNALKPWRSWVKVVNSQIGKSGKVEMEYCNYRIKLFQAHDEKGKNEPIDSTNLTVNNKRMHNWIKPRFICGIASSGDIKQPASGPDHAWTTCMPSNKINESNTPNITER